MIFITAPSKTQKIQTSPLPCASQDVTIPSMLAESKKLITALQKLSDVELGKLLKTSATLTASAYHLLHSFSTPFSISSPEKNSEVALRLFQGDAYSEIDVENYTEQEIAYAQRHLRILCGLYGILRPLDLVQPYRLEMQSKLAIEDKSNLYQFWIEKINNFLLAELDEKKEKVIINLASVEYSKIIDINRVNASGGKMITIIFQQPHQKSVSGYKTIPIYSKRARGMMINYAIRRKIKRVEDLQQFSCGYRYIREKSTSEQWVFRLL